MKKALKKIKASLAVLSLAVLIWQWKTQFTYWVLDSEDITAVNPAFSDPNMSIAIKIAQRVFVGVVFIIWIINLIKIKKTDDKVQRKKRIRRTIIIMSILVVILVAAFLIPTLLLK